MDKLALGIGLILVATGIIAYFGSGAVSWTALIPSVLGLIIAGLGGLAMWRPGARAVSLHLAALVALLGFLGSMQGVPDLIALLGGAAVDRPWAAGAQTVTAIVTAVLVVAHIYTFIRSRRN